MFISLARYTCGHFESSTCIFALPNKRGGRGSTPPGHHLARRLPRIRHEKCVREKFLLSLFMIGISGALMCRCLSNIFVRFLFFLSHFIFTFFFLPSNYPTRRSYVADPEPLALLLPLTCCRHHYK